ncbi:hypothetical protein GW17_00028317 [Ensete ventricosum]|nr:hypothetical protein GW17_00028317 [Ensete ventricosum]
MVTRTPTVAPPPPPPVPSAVGDGPPRGGSRGARDFFAASPFSSSPFPATLPRHPSPPASGHHQVVLAALGESSTSEARHAWPSPRCVLWGNAGGSAPSVARVKTPLAISS